MTYGFLFVFFTQFVFYALVLTFGEPVCYDYAWIFLKLFILIKYEINQDIPDVSLLPSTPIV